MFRFLPEDSDDFVVLIFWATDFDEPQGAHNCTDALAAAIALEVCGPIMVTCLPRPIWQKFEWVPSISKATHSGANSFAVPERWMSWLVSYGFQVLQVLQHLQNRVPCYGCPCLQSRAGVLGVFFFRRLKACSQCQATQQLHCLPQLPVPRQSTLFLRRKPLLILMLVRKG